uniref:Uncharacterized protein n=1 Tax=Arundo donax TaxID=35708 RepID=A0A0A8ZGX8_ARUDO
MLGSLPLDGWKSSFVLGLEERINGKIKGIIIFSFFSERTSSFEYSFIIGEEKFL